jgi:hypothetical protein
MGDVSINTPVETSERGTTASAVFVQDQTSDLLDVPFLKERTQAVLAQDVTAGDTVINLEAGHGATAGEILEMAESGTTIFIQARVLDVNVNAITIDQPANQDYAIANTIIVLSSDDMLVSGSLASPQIFSILPLQNQAGDMVRIILDIRGPGGMDFSKFGSDAALTNGCVLRVKKADGTFKNIFNWKNNGEFINRAFDFDFLVNTGNNQRAFVARRTFGGQGKNGVVIRLEGSNNEELQILIQDELTKGVGGNTNTEFRVIAQGHEIQE